MASDKYTLRQLFEEMKSDPARPTLSASLVMLCAACHGAKQIYYKRVIKDEQLAYELKLMITGHLETPKGSLPYNVPYPCDCKEKLKHLRAEVKKLQPIILGNWVSDDNTSRPNRGITDYNREIIFPRELNEAEMITVLEWLKRDNCPGWTGISVKNNQAPHGSMIYTFRTTMDSSD